MQRSRWYANVIGGGPDEMPLLAVSVRPTCSVPEMVGRCVLRRGDQVGRGVGRRRRGRDNVVHLRPTVGPGREYVRRSAQKLRRRRAKERRRAEKGQEVRLVQIDMPEAYFGTGVPQAPASAATKRLLPSARACHSVPEAATDRVDDYSQASKPRSSTVSSVGGSGSTH